MVFFRYLFLCVIAKSYFFSIISFSITSFSDFFLSFLFFFHSLVPSSNGKSIKLTTFIVRNVDYAKNLGSIVPLYFGVKSSTGNGLADRKSLCLFTSFQSLQNHIYKTKTNTEE